MRQVILRWLAEEAMAWSLAGTGGKLADDVANMVWGLNEYIYICDQHSQPLPEKVLKPAWYAGRVFVATYARLAKESFAIPIFAASQHTKS